MDKPRTPETIETMRDRLLNLEKGGFFTGITKTYIETMPDAEVADWIRTLTEILKPV